MHSGVIGGGPQINGSGIGRSASSRAPGQRFNGQSQPGYSGSGGYQNSNRTNRPIRRGVQI